jgi:hypothetical protein
MSNIALIVKNESQKISFATTRSGDDLGGIHKVECVVFLGLGEFFFP